MEILLDIKSAFKTSMVMVLMEPVTWGRINISSLVGFATLCGGECFQCNLHFGWGLGDGARDVVTE